MQNVKSCAQRERTPKVTIWCVILVSIEPQIFPRIIIGSVLNGCWKCPTLPLPGDIGIGPYLAWRNRVCQPSSPTVSLAYSPAGAGHLECSSRGARHVSLAVIRDAYLTHFSRPAIGFARACLVPAVYFLLGKVSAHTATACLRQQSHRDRRIAPDARRVARPGDRRDHHYRSITGCCSEAMAPSLSMGDVARRHWRSEQI